MLREPDVYLMLASGVAVAMPLLWLLRKPRWQTPLGGTNELSHGKVERKNIFGAMTFSTGWAVAGTCPGPALAMATGGGFLAVLVIAGLGVGLWLQEAVGSGRLLKSFPHAVKDRIRLAR